MSCIGLHYSSMETVRSSTQLCTMVGQTAPAPTQCSSPPRSNPSALKSNSRPAPYAFTPPISNKVPRPWERRPATPFAPRTESQKIWKRCERVAGQWSRSREKTMSAHDERRHIVKRMRIGNLRSGDEEKLGDWDGGFVGTRFEESDCDGVERRRKLANATSCIELCVNGDKERIGKTLSKESESRHSPARTNATFDGSASATSPRRTYTEGPTIPTDDDGPVAKGRVLPEMQRIQEIDKETIPGKTQVLHGCVGNSASSINGMTQETAKNSLLADGEDTEYLQAFLTRARAKKATRNLLNSPGQISKENQKPTPPSPQTRSRTVLAALDRNSPSPTKTRKLDMSIDKFEPNQSTFSDVRTISPVRKSSRTRMLQPQRHQPATPSSFPFRRSNGTEFVFLQKTEAQQISIATRSNTKRNKGDAMHPRKKLEALSSQQEPSPAKTARRKRHAKRVLWNEDLVYYFGAEELQASDVPLEQTEAKTPVKRSRRLAPGKGTPAPKKKMAEAAVEIGIPPPPPRIRTRAKSRA